MLVTMLWIALVILLALLEFMVFGFLVGGARARYKIAAPATIRTSGYSSEPSGSTTTRWRLLVVFIPSIWLFGMYLNPRWGAIIGAVFLVGRALYAIGYIRAPEKRESRRHAVLCLGGRAAGRRPLRCHTRAVDILGVTAGGSSHRTGGEALVDASDRARRGHCIRSARCPDLWPVRCAASRATAGAHHRCAS